MLFFFEGTAQRREKIIEEDSRREERAERKEHRSAHSQRSTWSEEQPRGDKESQKDAPKKSTFKWTLDKAPRDKNCWV